MNFEEGFAKHVLPFMQSQMEQLERDAEAWELLARNIPSSKVGDVIKVRVPRFVEAK